MAEGDIFCHWTFYGRAVAEGAAIGFVFRGVPEGEQVLITSARGVNGMGARGKTVRSEIDGFWQVFESVPDVYALPPYGVGEVAAESGAWIGVSVAFGVPVCRAGTAWGLPQWEAVTASLRMSSTEWIAVPGLPTSCGGWTLTIPLTAFSAVVDPVLVIQAKAHDGGERVAVARLPKVLRGAMLAEWSRGSAIGLLLPWRNCLVDPIAATPGVGASRRSGIGGR